MMDKIFAAVSLIMLFGFVGVVIGFVAEVDLGDRRYHRVADGELRFLEDAVARQRQERLARPNVATHYPNNGRSSAVAAQRPAATSRCSCPLRATSVTPNGSPCGPVSTGR